MNTTPRPKPCAQCGGIFTPVRPLQRVCSPLCASKLVKQAKKVDRESTRERKVAIKSRQQWLAECQAIVNKYVRLRDHDEGCISCDKPSTWQGQWHASHFRSRGAASSIRFNLWNIHKACSVCNNHLSGNLSAYEPRLREKIGSAKVDWLRTQNQITRYDIPYLERLKKIFTKRVKRMEKRVK